MPNNTQVTNNYRWYNWTDIIISFVSFLYNAKIGNRYMGIKEGSS